MAKNKKTTTKTSRRLTSTRVPNPKLPPLRTNQKPLRIKRRAGSKFPLFPFASKVSVAMITICITCVIGAILAHTLLQPRRLVENAIDRLASAYYVDYLYPSSLGADIDNPARLLSRYARVGLPSVRLRQLIYHRPSSSSAALASSEESLLTTDYSHLSSAARTILNTPAYHCDTNSSSIRFYPVDPYGPYDYKVTYNLNCQDLTK